MKFRGLKLRRLAHVAGVLAALVGSERITSAQEPICSSPDVIFCEGFESASWTNRWQEVSHPELKTRDSTAGNVFSGQASLRATFPPNSTNGAGWMHYWWNAPAGQGTVYMRWYVKYGTGFNWGTWDVKMAGLSGHPPGVRYGPGAGIVPDGTFFDLRPLALGVANGPASPREPLLYYSHMNQSRWGDFYYQHLNPPAVAFQTNRWYCMEIMVAPNNPTQANGEMKMWIDGALKAHGTGIRWRNRADVEVSDLFWAGWVGEPSHTSNQYRWEDNIVVSRAPIGCSTAGVPPPGPPSNLRIIR